MWGVGAGVVVHATEAATLRGDHGVTKPSFFPGRKPRARDTRDRGTINTQHPPRDSVQRPRSLNLDRKNAGRLSERRSFYGFQRLERARTNEIRTEKNTQILRITLQDICTAIILDTLTSRLSFSSDCRPDYVNFDRVQ